MASAVLQATGLTKQYFRAGRSSARTFCAVDDVSLSLAPGELVVLTGRSGSGKSTLLTMLAGLLAPTAGTVALGGQDLYALGDAALSRLRNQSVGVVPQGQTPLHSLTVVENVKLPQLMYGAAGEAEADARAMGLLGSLGVAELAECYPSELSGGELRRMAIARALVNSPALVLADEPTADLDDENTAVVLAALREAAKGGAAVLMVTHEHIAPGQADRLLRMSAGRLV